MTYEQICQDLREKVDQALSGFFLGSNLEEPMRYSLMAGGKRIRPILLLKFCCSAGGTLEQAMDAACGVEMLHTYSLIHDDLPCMDDDGLRRGKPTCHTVFGECNATLAGDALQAAAFESVLGSPLIEEGARLRMGQILARAAGYAGMCRGQFLDMKQRTHAPELEEVAETYAGKTVALIKASCLMGVLAAGQTERTEEFLTVAENYAEHLGMAFQIRDDVLDVISTEKKLGKPIGSDQLNGKYTFMTLLGKDSCLELVKKHTSLARQAVEGRIPDDGFFCFLADGLAERMG